MKQQTVAQAISVPIMKEMGGPNVGPQQRVKARLEGPVNSQVIVLVERVVFAEIAMRTPMDIVG